uniref:ABC1 atypical kinase-like domain-containing protein n=1 Tax=Salix viminalis TaxID=40686 RepID=A0A6N2K4E0_SALVM
MPPLIDFKDIQEKLSTQFRPWQRSFQFWVRAADIYSGYKVFQLRVSLVKDVEKQEAMWERQHEFAADKIYAMCSDLGGFFLKIAQIIGKPDLAPEAWVRRLVTLCDRAPATPFDTVKLVLEKELGRSIEDIFERFDMEPLGSASIAQVHRARLKGDKSDIVVKVQHPGIQDLMITDIHNLQAFALYMQKTDIKFDLFSVTKEMEKQIGYEFDFKREANAMERIRQFLYENNKASPVVVPRVLKDMVSRRALVMEYIDGIPILNLGDEIAQRGINPGGKIAAAAKQNILKSLTLAYGQMILKSGFFHADPHPGNILICKDYGQVKDLPDKLRLGYANLVLAIADRDPVRAAESYRELGIDTVSKCKNEQQELLRLAETMFDTKLPPGVSMLQPFSEDSSIKKISVEAFPEELFSVLRTVHLLRGLSVGLGINYSCAEQWRPIAEEALYLAGRLKDTDLQTKSRRRRLETMRVKEKEDVWESKGFFFFTRTAWRDRLPRSSKTILSLSTATLMKLKLGSHRDQSSPFEETVDMESESSSTTSASSFMESNNSSTTALKSLQHVITSPDEEAMTLDSDRSSACDQLSFSSMQSTGDSKDQRSRNVSVLFLFSKYTNSRQALTPFGELVRCNLIAGNCSTSTYASCSNSQSPGISKEQSEHECLSSSSACQK